MVFIDDSINIYVDFLPITETTSADDALALLISTYTIFELAFPKNSRTVRLLYSVFHKEKRFLTNTIRLFLQKKEIDMDSKPLQKELADSASAKNDSSLDAASSQTLVEGGTPTNKSNALSKGNSTADDDLSTTAITQITRVSPMKSPDADDR